LESRIEVSWTCRMCEVEGQDAQAEGPDAQEVEAGPPCWNCGGPVIVTARPTVRLDPGPDAA
jgi:hypothetical protein